MVGNALRASYLSSNSAWEDTHVFKHERIGPMLGAWTNMNAVQEDNEYVVEPDDFHVILEEIATLQL